jgi:hypothetical protein
LPNEKQAPKELKVFDKRIFNADGEIRDEFKQEIRPTAATPAPPPAEATPPPPPAERRGEDASRAAAEKAQNPGTPFTDFIEPLIAQGYMLLGMLRNPYQPQTKIDPAAARQMIDILTLLKEKTAGNLTPEEEDFLTTHLGDLKLAFVQRTKTI